VAIRDYIRVNKFSPTYQEIADVIGKSKVTARDSVALLLTKGLLFRKPGRYRNLVLTYVGSVAANHPPKKLRAIAPRNRR
jgi:predicted DNA-binding transcriptional regulator